MLTWLLRNRIRAFERTWDYDMGYARELVDADTGAFLAFARAQGMGAYRKDVPREAYYAAKLAGTVAEDCGPCTQLVVSMALREGVEPTLVAAIVRGDEAALREDARLGLSYARAVLAHAPEAEALRAQIVAAWGPRALVSLAFALTMARVYPTLKYALGHGQACQRVVVAGQPVAVLRGET